MREIEYLSPSRINLWARDKETFFVRYLADAPRLNEPQTRPMAIGSAFDAQCKSYLHKELAAHHNTEVDERFILENIFAAQVDPDLHEWAKPHSEYVLEQYKSSGALYDLLFEIKKNKEASQHVRFEFEVKGAVMGEREGVTKTIGNVTLLGKPDMAFINEEGHQVILDWKVSGYCSPRTTSPMPGYLRLRSGGRNEFGAHKNALPIVYKGTKINGVTTLDQCNKEWATQLAVYSWLMGNPIGGDAIFAIDQVVCSQNPSNSGLPVLRFAEHRLLIDASFQRLLWNKICEMWDVVRSDHIFRDVSYEESKQRCHILTEFAKTGDEFDLECKRIV